MKLLVKLAVVLLLLSPLQKMQAQIPGGAGLNSVILKLFGKQDNFTVDSEFQMKKAQVTVTMVITVSAGKLRAEADMNSCRGPGVNAELQAQMKQLKSYGMDRVVSITRPDKNRLYRLFPNRKTYEEAPMPKEGANPISKMKKTPLARETIDGHPCLKNNVVLMDDKEHQQQMTVWEATDLQNFPIKVELNEGGETMVVHNKNIRLGKPLASQFEVPAGYTKAAVK